MVGTLNPTNTHGIQSFSRAGLKNSIPLGLGHVAGPKDVILCSGLLEYFLLSYWVPRATPQFSINYWGVAWAPIGTPNCIKRKQRAAGRSFIALPSGSLELHSSLVRPAACPNKVYLRRRTIRAGASANPNSTKLVGSGITTVATNTPA